MENREVVILEPAILGLVGHFQKSGQRMQTADVRTKVERGMARGWGTPSAKPFSDSHGAGWIVDLSDQFNDEMLYAVVRSSGGSRQVVAIIEADDIEALQKEKKPLPSVASAFGESDEAGSIEGSEVAQRPAKQARPPVGVTSSASDVAPTAPAIILVTRSVEGDSQIENFIRTTHGEARDVVARLLRDGIRPEHIEIWTGVRKPKVQIAFE